MSELSISAAPKGLSVDKDLALSIHFDWRTLIPLASVAFTQILHTVLPVASTYRTKVLQWFVWFNIVTIGALVILAMESLFNSQYREGFTYKSWFAGAVFLLINLYKPITVKFDLIPIQGDIIQNTLYNGRGQSINARAAKENAPIAVIYYTSEADYDAGQNGFSEAPSEAGIYYARIQRPEGSGYRQGRDIKVEYRIQKAMQAPEFLSGANQQSTDNGALSTDNGALSTDNGALSTDNGVLSTDNGALSTDNGALSTDNDVLSTDNGALSTDNGALSTDNGALSTDNGALSTDNDVLSTDNGALSVA